MHTWQHLLLGASTTLVFAAFAWGVKRHFLSDGMQPRMKAISILGMANVVACLVELWRSPAPSTVATIVALSLQSIALALFLGAVWQSRKVRLPLAFSDGVPTAVILGGPYRWTRHPFYLSYMIFWAGCALATQSVVVIVLSGALLGLYAIAAIEEERALAASPLRSDYECYRRTTGLFWPRLRGARHP